MVISLANRDLVTIDDLSNREIEAVFNLADEMSASMGEQFGVCQGKIMASLFFEPSTRTRLSFEAAMHRLGGRVISVTEMSNTSLAKGESIADMARVVGSYADILVIRHPWEGAAKVVADYADVPVINAGDGGHEHPSQTLLDLYTLKKERNSLEGLKIALWGDLKYGRTVHSLACALARFGATIHFRPSPGFEMPEHVIRKLTTEYTGRLERYNGPHEGEKGLIPLDAIYVTPSGPHQLANIPAIGIQMELDKGVDALYVTRLQKERLEPAADGEGKKAYPIVDKKLFGEKGFNETIIMHPLPRVGELAYEIDADKRSMYFKQAARGVPIRMALLALLLGAKDVDLPERRVPSFAQKKEYPVYKRNAGITCQNRKCISMQETEQQYMKQEFQIVSGEPLTLRCIYCEHEIHPPYVASSKWHQGIVENKRYYRADSYMVCRIRPENLIIFNSEEAARRQGFKPGKRGKPVGNAK